MTEKKAVRTGIIPSDMDGQGNVVLWDHGPLEPKAVPGETEEAKRVRYDAATADAKLWHEKHGDGPAPIAMHSSDASHAMMIEPDRYALEPFDVDEDEVARRVKEMKDKREAARDGVQNAIDRKTAIAAIMSDRENERLTSEAEPEPEPQRPVPVLVEKPVEEV